jgi:hypothetical protein
VLWLFLLIVVQNRVPSWRLNEIETKLKTKEEEMAELLEETPNAEYLMRSISHDMVAYAQ